MLLTHLVVNHDTLPLLGKTFEGSLSIELIKDWIPGHIVLERQKVAVVNLLNTLLEGLSRLIYFLDVALHGLHKLVNIIASLIHSR